MKRLIATSIAVICAAAVAVAPAQASHRKLGCALGKGGPSEAAHKRQAHRIIGAEKRRFLATLESAGKARRHRAGADFERALAAYFYGYPQVILRRTIKSYPVNSMVSVARLADASIVQIPAPNQDTLYSVGQIDLRSGPMVISSPPTGGRYSVLQLTDAFTNVAGYIGNGRRERTGDLALVVPPGWKGRVPAGMRLIRANSATLWLLGRTYSSGAADSVAAGKLLSRYSVTPLAEYEQGARTPPLVLSDFPGGREPIVAPRGLDFYDELGADLLDDPPPRQDACALRVFARSGIGPGMTPSQSASGLRARALTAAADAGPRAMAKLSRRSFRLPGATINGWTRTPRDIARFGTDYLTRAIVSRVGFGANLVHEALYPTADRDSRGRLLRGRRHYVVHFKRGQLPPVRAFWSVTLYDKKVLFYDNPLNRYSLGSHSAGMRRDADGGLTIYVSHHRPKQSRLGNWLPAPKGIFTLYLRLYEPKASAVRHKWRPPPIRRVR